MAAEIFFNWSQFWGIIISLIVTVVIVLTFFYFLRKVDPMKPTESRTALLAENMVVSWENASNEIHERKLVAANPYFLSILMFISITAVIGLFGYDNGLTSLAYTFTLALITFIGIYVIGITTHGFWGFIKHKYKNPLELISQFGPIISMTIRLFGGAFAFGALLTIIPIILKSLNLGGIALYWPLFGALFNWSVRAIDVGLSLLQAYVFAVLTIMYWDMEMGHKETKEERLVSKEVKRAKKINKASLKGNSVTQTQLEYNISNDQTRNFDQQKRSTNSG